MQVYLCSNKDCRAVYDFDPKGHCPTCLSPSGRGWSCITVELKTAETVVLELRDKFCAERPAKAASSALTSTDITR